MPGVAIHVLGCITQLSAGFEPKAVDLRVPPQYPPPREPNPSGFRVSTGSNPSPVSAVSWAGTGHKVRTFSADWYNRIHITPSVINAGNLMSLQTYDVTVWNAYFIPQTLNSILETKDSGVLLVKPGEPPRAYNALKAEIYQLTVSIQGPPTVSGSFLFSFTNDTVQLRAGGNRIVVWPFMPQHGVTESLEWKTDILKTKVNEQRIALRDSPRQGFQYTYWMTERESVLARAIAYGWSHRVYGVPVWTECTYVGRLAEGASVIALDTTTADYRAGDTIIIWEGSEKFEAAGVESIEAGALFLKLPTALDFQSAYVCPMRYARSKGVEVKRASNLRTISEVEFEVTLNKDLNPTNQSVGYPEFEGWDVLTDLNYSLGAHDERIHREVVTIDNGFGVIYTDPVRDRTDQTFTMSWTLKNRAEVWKVRKWLHVRKGKWKPFWVQSQQRDLQIVLDAADSSEGFDVRSINYELYYGVKHIVISRHNGVRTFHRVLGGLTNGEVDSLSVQGTLGARTLISDVDYISFMYKVRLDADRIEIEHTEAGFVTIRVPVIEVKD